MRDPWMPGLVHDPGNGAGYSVGRNRMEIVKVHKTAGNSSYNVVKNGVVGAPSTLAQFLVPYTGVPWQFTEADALCYDSGPYNDDGPGIEIEAPVTGGAIRPGLSEFRELSPSQVEWTGKIVRWLHDEWGVPLALYDGPRFQATATGWRGFVNHGDLDDQRTDGITREEWDAMTFTLPPLPPEEEEDDMPKLVASLENPKWGIFLLDVYGLRHVDNPKAVDELVDKGVVSNKRVKGKVEIPEINADGWTALVNGDEVVKRLMKLPG